MMCLTCLMLEFDMPTLDMWPCGFRYRFTLPCAKQNKGFVSIPVDYLLWFLYYCKLWAFYILNGHIYYYRYKVTVMQTFQIIVRKWIDVLL